MPDANCNVINISTFCVFAVVRGNIRYSLPYIPSAVVFIVAPGLNASLVYSYSGYGIFPLWAGFSLVPFVAYMALRRKLQWHANAGVGSVFRNTGFAENITEAAYHLTLT